MPKKRQALAQYQAQAEAAEPHVEALVPFMNDPDSPEYASAQAVLKVLPEVKRLPHWKLTVGVYALGLKEFARRRQALTNGNGRMPAATTKTPPAQPGKPAVAGSTSGSTTDAVRKRFYDTGDSQSADEFLKQALRFQGVLK